MNKKIKTVICSIGLITILSDHILLNYSKEMIKDKNIKINRMIEDSNKKDKMLRSQKIEIENKEIEINDKDIEIIKKNEEINKKNDKIDRINKELEEIKRERSSRRMTNNYSSKSNSPLGREIKVELTGYCNDYACSGNWGGITALGTKTRKGVVAAPPNISLGSKLKIPELSWYKSDAIFDVEDRGGAVKQKSDGTYIIDVWFPSHEQALKFGRVKSTGYIIN